MCWVHKLCTTDMGELDGEIFCNFQFFIKFIPLLRLNFAFSDVERNLISSLGYKLPVSKVKTLNQTTTKSNKQNPESLKKVF